MLAILDVDSAVDGLSAMHNVPHDDNMVAALGVMVGLAAVVLIFSTPIVIVLAMLRQRTNKQRLVNELALRLADKGQQIPPELFMEPLRPKSDMRRGVIWMAVGMGVVMAGAVGGDSDIMGLGFIPAMIGLGFFIAGRLERRQLGG